MPAMIIWILVFFAIFYFLAIRPQRRQQRAHQEMVGALEKGDEVTTIGGLMGTVTRIGDDWIELAIARRTRVRMMKRAVSSVAATSIDELEDEEIIDAEDEWFEEEEELVDDVVREAVNGAELRTHRESAREDTHAGGEAEGEWVEDDESAEETKRGLPA